MGLLETLISNNLTKKTLLEDLDHVHTRVYSEGGEITHLKLSCHNLFMHAISALCCILEVATMDPEIKLDVKGNLSNYFQTAMQCRKLIHKQDVATHH